MMHLVKKDAKFRLKKEDAFMRWKRCLFFWCTFLVLVGAQMAPSHAVGICPQASRTLFDEKEQLPSSRLDATLSSTFFDRQAEFPNYFLPEAYRGKSAGQIPASVVQNAEKKLAEAMASLFRRMTLPVEENGKIVQRRYFEEIGNIALGLP